MVHFCCAPACTNNSNRDKQLSFYSLPLKRKCLLKQWVHAIGRKKLPINRHTRTCSKHFVGASKRLLRSDEIPTLHLPHSSRNTRPRKPPKERTNPRSLGASDMDEPEVRSKEVAIQTEVSGTKCGCDLKLESLENEVRTLKLKCQERKFSLSNIKDDDSKIIFYTGFPSYATLISCYEFLGPAVHSLVYDASKEVLECETNKRCRPRALSPENDFFLVLVRLRLGLMEQDLADRFEISQSTASRIILTWIHFLFLKFQEIPIWPPRDFVHSHMPRQFKEKYPTTRVIIDATEIFISQPRLPELQQMTFSNYKNHNTFKALVGISPSGAITFVSKLFPGCISEKELTRHWLNIPPFLKGKEQFEEHEIIATRRIASLRIHVERAMERIKNFHIFDRVLPPSLTDIADRLFLFVAFCPIFIPPYVINYSYLIISFL